MATINLLVAVDGTVLAAKVAKRELSAGSADAPTNLGTFENSGVSISMVAPHGYTCNNDFSPDLKIKATPGDKIQWIMTTFDGNQQQTAYLYRSSFQPSAAIAPLSYSCSQFLIHLATGNPPQPSGLTRFIGQANLVDGTIMQAGSVTQSLLFVLVDNENGVIKGYFQWDAFIRIY